MWAGRGEDLRDSDGWCGFFFFRCELELSVIRICLSRQQARSTPTSRTRTVSLVYRAWMLERRNANGEKRSHAVVMQLRPPSLPLPAPHLISSAAYACEASLGETPPSPRGGQRAAPTIHGPWLPRSHLAHGCISLNRPRTGREARCSASSRCPTPRKRWEAKGCCRPRRPRSSGKPRSPLRRA
jgi:hypothetical protein